MQLDVLRARLQEVEDAMQRERDGPSDEAAAATLALVTRFLANLAANLCEELDKLQVSDFGPPSYTQCMHTHKHTHTHTHTHTHKKKGPVVGGAGPGRRKGRVP